MSDVGTEVDSETAMGGIVSDNLLMYKESPIKDFKGISIKEASDRVIS